MSLRLSNKLKKIRNKLILYFSVFSVVFAMLCSFVVTAESSYTVYPYQVNPYAMNFRVVNSDSSQSTIYATEDFDTRHSVVIQDLGSTTYWRDASVFASSSGNWDLNYGHSLMMQRFMITQYGLIDGREYDISVPFFIMAPLNYDINLSVYGGDMRYSDSLTKIAVKSVQQTKSTFSFDNGDGTQNIYNGYFGVFKGRFTYNSLYSFDSLRVTLYFNSAKGRFRFFGIYNAITFSEVDALSSPNYSKVDDSDIQNGIQIEDDIFQSLSGQTNDTLNFIKNFDVNSFRVPLAAVSNSLEYLFGFAWIGSIWRYSLSIGIFAFILGLSIFAISRSRRR